MTDEVARLRSQAERCRRLAEFIPDDNDHAMLRRVASEIDKAADELEKKER